MLVDKPAGITSHDVVLAARRATGESRIGHAGTLDPFATGLLVLLLGRATRLLPYMSGEPKRYEAAIRFGVETGTDDLHGAPVRTAPVPPPDEVARAIPTLTGRLAQVPPAYSAKRLAGRRAYDLAREGEPVELAPVEVMVHEWHPGPWDGDTFHATIVCGGGTYIRALARDLGRLTSSAAHLTALRRTAIGPFRVDDAASYEALRDGTAALLPPLAALEGVPRQPLAPDDITRVTRGQEVAAACDGPAAALIAADTGALVAYAERRGARWQPRVVMQPVDGDA